MEALLRFYPGHLTACCTNQQLQQQNRYSCIPISSTRFTVISKKSSFLPIQGFKLRKPVACALQPTPVSTKEQFHNGSPSPDVLELWRTADAVCFDVDSTVCIDEGIDELADFCGAGEAVAQLTSKAMNGSVTFQEALTGRLSLINPSLAKLQEFLESRPPRISPGIADLVKTLKDKKKEVYLVSGGFRHMINPVATILDIPLDNIFANQLLFDNSGMFSGFDRDEPTSKSGGKAIAVQRIRKAHAYKTMVMIGDGATDLEARQPGGADLFICYAGVQHREAVADKADWLVFDFKDVISALEFHSYL